MTIMLKSPFSAEDMSVDMRLLINDFSIDCSLEDFSLLSGIGISAENWLGRSQPKQGTVRQTVFTSQSGGWVLHDFTLFRNTIVSICITLSELESHTMMLQWKNSNRNQDLLNRPGLGSTGAKTMTLWYMWSLSNHCHPVFSRIVSNAPWYFFWTMRIWSRLVVKLSKIWMFWLLFYILTTATCTVIHVLSNY